MAYYDFHKEKHCVTDKHHHDEYIGCFAAEEMPALLSWLCFACASLGHVH